MRDSYVAMSARDDAKYVEDREAVDFSNASLYVPAVQLITTVVLCTVVMLVTISVPPPSEVTALRTLTGMVAVATAGVWRPIRIGSPRGLHEIFKAGRPVVAVYVLALVVEQLCHACTHDHRAPRCGADKRAAEADVGGVGGVDALADCVEDHVETSLLVTVFSLLLVAGMVAGGFMQSRNHIRSDDLLPHIVVVTCAVVHALLPQSAVGANRRGDGGGAPFCDRVTLYGAAVRLLRACTFASVFVIHTYLCIENNVRYIRPTDMNAASVRALAASVWTLVCPSIVLGLAIVQCVLATWWRTHDELDTHGGRDSPAGARALRGAEPSDTSDNGEEWLDEERRAGASERTSRPPAEEPAPEPSSDQRDLIELLTPDEPSTTQGEQPLPEARPGSVEPTTEAAERGTEEAACEPSAPAEPPTPTSATRQPASIFAGMVLPDRCSTPGSAQGTESAAENVVANATRAHSKFRPLLVEGD
jgi:hypothetical protein